MSPPLRRENSCSWSLNATGTEHRWSTGPSRRATAPSAETEPGDLFDVLDDRSQSPHALRQRPGTEQRISVERPARDGTGHRPQGAPQLVGGDAFIPPAPRSDSTESGSRGHLAQSRSFLDEGADAHDLLRKKRQRTCEVETSASRDFFAGRDDSKGARIRVIVEPGDDAPYIPCNPPDEDPRTGADRFHDLHQDSVVETTIGASDFAPLRDEHTCEHSVVGEYSRDHLQVPILEKCEADRITGEKAATERKHRAFALRRGHGASCSALGDDDARPIALPNAYHTGL